MRILKTLAGILALLVLGLVIWLAVKPPELLRVGTGYAAKIVCSNVFIAGRDADAVLADDVQGSVEIFVLEAIVMERKAPSYGNRQGTSGSASCGA
ncbi:hypothetical protein BR141012304_11645 [Brucella inopinata]|nr:hypothetical protein BR141012304_11645 [Brucella inopinata]